MCTWCRNEWVERNVNGKAVYCVPRVVCFFHCPPHVVRTHKFSNPYSADSALLLLLFRTFMSTLTYHPFCFLSMRTCWCWWVVEKGKTFLSILFNCVWVRATLNWACRKYNQFYFVRTHPTLAHISAALKHLVDPHRASRKTQKTFLTFSENEIL